MKTCLGLLAAVLILFATLGCSDRADTASYKDNVKNALEQADLKGLTVDEDNDKNTITLHGTLHSQNAKEQASQIAQSAAGNRIIANEISVEPVGAESQSKDIESNTDGAIEKNYKAALLAKGLDKQSIHFSANNGVLTLKGTVKTVAQRQQAQELASKTPNVAQVLNEIKVQR